MGHSSTIDPLGRDTEGGESRGFLRENPFYRPIGHLFRSISIIEWKLPFIADIIQFLALCIVIIILFCLYVTIGIASQISNTFLILIRDTGRRIQQGSSIEKSAYMVATGVYLALFLPFWLIQSPFQLLGWCWGKFGIFTFFIIAVFALSGYGCYVGGLSLRDAVRLVRVSFGFSRPLSVLHDRRLRNEASRG